MTTTLPKPKFQISSTLAVKVVEQLYKEHPALVQDTLRQVEKPDPTFNFKFLLLKVLQNFCNHKGFHIGHIQGINIGQQRKWQQTLFIAVVLKLYSPGVFLGIYDMENGIREELAGMLECNASGISQQLTGIVSYMRERNYTEFKDQVNEMVDVMKREITVKEVKQEERVNGLFQ